MGEEAPCETKQNFGCWEKPLRNLGKERLGPGAASRRLRHRAQEPRAALRPVASGLGPHQPPGRRLDSPPGGGRAEAHEGAEMVLQNERRVRTARAVSPGGDPSR